MRRIPWSLLVAILPFGSALADAPKEKNAKVILVYQHELPLTPVKEGVRPESVRRPQSGAEVPWLARLTSLSPGALADSERRSDSQGAQNGAKSPQDGGRGSSIWEISV